MNKPTALRLDPTIREVMEQARKKAVEKNREATLSGGNLYPATYRGIIERGIVLAARELGVDLEAA